MDLKDIDYGQLREQLQRLLENYNAYNVQFCKSGSRLIPKRKNGNKIHIKKKNRGKFTESANRAGQSVQEYARSVLNDPNATPLQKKRANFARNAKAWSK